MRMRVLVCAVLWAFLGALVMFRSVTAQQATFAMTPTGYFYPLGTSAMRTSCATSLGGYWLGRDEAHGGCYTSGSYHTGYDMMFIKSSGIDAYDKPAFAAATGTVKFISTGGWTMGGTTNYAVMLQHSTTGGQVYYSLYGHLRSDTIRFQVNDVVPGGVMLGRIGSWSTGNHIHFGIFPNSYPSNGLGLMPNSSWPSTNGAVDPLNWIMTQTPRCQNGGSNRYNPPGGIRHPNGSIIQTYGNGTIYVLQNGNKRGITSANLLWELYGPGRGFDFSDVIMVSSAELNSYPTSTAVTSALPYNGRNQPDGRLIRQWGGGEISIVSNNGYRRPFASADAMLNLGYQFCNIAGVSDYNSYPKGPDIVQ